MSSVTSSTSETITQIQPSQTQSSPSLFHNTFNHLVQIKLDRTNYLLWKSQILPTICGHNLGSFLFGTTRNRSKYQFWRHLLGSTRSTVSILASWILVWNHTWCVVGYKMANKAWNTIEMLLALQTSSNVMQLQFQLQNTEKNKSTVNDYFLKIKHLPTNLLLLLNQWMTNA